VTCPRTTCHFYYQTRAIADRSSFYIKLLGAINHPVFREGQWNLWERAGWPENQSHQNLVAWSWNEGEDRYFIVVNLSDSPGQARIKVSWENLGGSKWRLTDPLCGEDHERSGDDVLSSGQLGDREVMNKGVRRSLAQAIVSETERNANDSKSARKSTNVIPRGHRAKAPE
jgi:hypothetical protein